MTRLLLLMNAKKTHPTQYFYSSMKNNKQISNCPILLSNVLACGLQKPKMTLDETPA